MRNLLFSLFTLFFLLSCSSKESTVSDIERIPISIQKGKELKLSSFVDSIQIIPLETTSESLIGHVHRIVYRDNRYYIRVTQGMLNGRLLIFDANGKFLFKLHRHGGGPGEWVEMEDFVLTSDSKIKLLTYHKSMTFDLEGNFLYEHKIENHLTKEIIPSADHKYIIYSMNAPLRNYCLLSVMNKDDQFEREFFQVDKDQVGPNECVYSFNSLFHSAEGAYFNYPYCNTIYDIADPNNLLPAYYLDYGNQSIPSNLFREDDRANVILDKLEKLNGYGRATTIGVTKNLVYVGSQGYINNNHSGFFSLYSKASKTVLTGNKIVDDMYFIGNSMSLEKSKRLPYNFDGQDILWQVSPFYILKGYNKYRKEASDQEWEAFCRKYPRLIEICKQMKEDDNPVLLRVTLKDF